MKIRAKETGMILVGLLLAISSSIQPMSGQNQPRNSQLTSEAWDEFKKNKYDRAIAKANECISEYQGAADRAQSKLEHQHLPLPPTGKVPSRQQQIIFERGLLNDVATCFFIKGQSLESLGRRDQAREAYGAAANYTYARTWDPDGKFFWSPSESASDHLKQLK